MYCLNAEIITTPLAKKNVDLKVKAGFGSSLSHKVDFEWLDVIIGNGRIMAGCKVAVLSENCTQPWAMKERLWEDKKVIVVPESAVVVVEYQISKNQKYVSTNV